MTTEERAVLLAARGVVNCLGSEYGRDATAWVHVGGGGCLQVLLTAVDALDDAPARHTVGLVGAP